MNNCKPKTPSCYPNLYKTGLKNIVKVVTSAALCGLYIRDICKKSQQQSQIKYDIGEYEGPEIPQSEVIKAIKKQKNGKAPGPDNIITCRNSQNHGGAWV